jgi:hypothetical protein
LRIKTLRFSLIKPPSVADMAIPILISIIPQVVTAAEILGGVSAGLNIINQFQPKPNDTKKILQAILDLEGSIIDAITSSDLDKQLIAIRTTEDWWIDVGWPQLDQGKISCHLCRDNLIANSY